MPIPEAELNTVRSPAWWLKRLYGKLMSGYERHDLLDRYYRNEVGVPVLSSKAVQDAYQRLMQLCRTNYAELVVEAVRERMMPVAFRTGASGDENGDAEAWRIWQANDLDADSLLNHRNSLAMGDGYVIVGPVDNEIDAPLITIEDPREVVVEADPRHKRKTLAGLKLYKDDIDNVYHAYLYLPDGIHHAIGAVPSWSGSTAPPFNATDWSWEGDVVRLFPSDDGPVTITRFPNRPDSFGRSSGEFETHLPLLDRINYGILNRLEVATLQAFRQRAIKGIDPTDDEGEPIDFDNIFAASPGSLWLLPETADLWESGQVDLTPLKEAIRDDVQDLAAVTRTPLFYLTPEATDGSAEGAALAREGLIFKTGDRITQAGEGWERVMLHAFMVAGDSQRSNRRDMQVIWAPPERYTLAERYDAATKAQSAGVPWRQTMETVLQFSPQEIARMEAERLADEMAAQPVPTEDGPTELEQLKDRAEVWGQLVRGGATPESAAQAAGLTGLEFLDAMPVTLKLNEDEPEPAPTAVNQLPPMPPPRPGQPPQQPPVEQPEPEPVQ